MLLRNHFGHSRSVDPVTKVDCVLSAVVIVKHLKPGDQKVGVGLVRKLMPFALIGAVGAFPIGILIVDESVTPMRLLAAALIVVGLVMMKLSSTH